MAETSSNGASAPTKSHVQIIQDVFGEPPRDVLLPAHLAVDVLDWLHALFVSIGRSTDLEQIQSLARLGEYVAFNDGDHIGSLYEKMSDSLKAYKSKGDNHD
jgi:hypothetical protein